MTLENTGLSRRKLLRTTAIGVPAAGLLAFGSTLVTAPSANSVDVDGYWGSGTSLGFQQFMNAVRGSGLTTDGVISSQPSSFAPSCSGIVGGWEWVEDSQASGSPAIVEMQNWLGVSADGLFGAETVSALQTHYGLTVDGTLDGPSPTIQALQNEINQYVISDHTNDHMNDVIKKLFN